MRSTTKLMKNWQFTGPDGKTTAVDLPHTWNNIDGQDGGNDYWRGTCIYKTRFTAPATTAATPPSVRMSRRCWPTAMS